MDSCSWVIKPADDRTQPVPAHGDRPVRAEREDYLHIGLIIQNNACINTKRIVPTAFEAKEGEDVREFHRSRIHGQAGDQPFRP
jgi:hypothetical protein